MGGVLPQLSQELAELVERVMPAIVALSGAETNLIVTGSGFLIDDLGHVLTNHHVVKDLRMPLDAVLHGGLTRKAELVGDDPLTDLAL